MKIEDHTHRPVLLEETLELLDPGPGSCIIDGTVGSGGHAEAILERTAPDGVLIGIDRDPDAIRRSGERLGRFGSRCVLIHGNHVDMKVIAGRHGVTSVDGILLDLGVSSEQFDEPERGFSFMRDAPLDMRMDTSKGCSAGDLLNTLSEQELADILKRFGEERMARRIAKAIIHERARTPLATTGELARVVAAACGGRRGAIHPATRTFQALRIAVNNELDGLRRALPAGLGLLREGGRMVVISFHSLEDRIAKKQFAVCAGSWESLPAGGRAWRGEDPTVKLLVRKPLRPSDDEVRGNPRSRSAKLRSVERIARGGVTAQGTVR